MKNKARVHHIPTNKPEEWWKHLYITTDEEIKVGDWVLWFWDGGQIGVTEPQQYLGGEQVLNSGHRKIIATTDPKLHTNKVVKEDMHMYKKSLPQIPQSFMEEYCKAVGIDEVLVEVDVTPHESTGDIVNINGENEKVLRVHLSPLDNIWWFVYKKNEEELMHQCNVTITPKIDSNNCIIIHPVKEKMIPLSEVKSLIKKYNSDLFTAQTMELPFDGNKWIEENL